MRKVLSFVLVLSLVLGSFGMAFAAPLSDVAGEDFEEAVNVLTDLDVISGYPDGTYKPAGIVTRAEMAVIVIRAMGLQDYVGGTSGYPDMAGFAWAEGYVNYAKNLGIIAGYPDGTFKPGNTVTYQEAAKMFVAALGYTQDSLIGTWPANYVVKAQSLGILDGVSGGANGANRGDIAVMAYQTMDQQFGKVDADGAFVPNVGGDTMFGRLGATKAAVAKVITESDASAINLRSYIGAYADYYTKDNKIIAVETKSTFMTGELLASGKFKVDGVEYSFGGTAFAATDSFVNKVWNAAVVVAPAAGDYTMAVDVSGKTISEVYSYNVWTTATGNDDRVSSVDVKKITASTPSLLGETFVLDKSLDIDMDAFELVGVDSLDDIAKDNVVYVYSDGTDITKVEVGTEIVTGKVTRYDTSGNEKVTIDGEVYEFVDGALYASEKPPASLDVGQTLKLYLDVNGDIYDYSIEQADPDSYGVVLREQQGLSAAGALSGGEDLDIELFLADGTVKVFTVDPDAYDETTDTLIADITVTGTGDADGDGTYDAGTRFDFDYVAGDVIKYELNSDGEIKAIDWLVDVGTTAKATNEKLTKNAYFDGYAVDSAAVVLAYSTLNTDEDNYSVSNVNVLLDTTITGDAYYEVDNNKIVFMYVPAAAVDVTDVYGVITGSSKVSTTAPKYEVNMLIDGVAKTYAIDADITGFSMVDTLYLLDFKADGVTLNTLDLVNLAGTDHDYNAKTTNSSDVLDLSGSTVKAYTSVGAASTFLVNGSGAFTSITLDADVIVYVKDGTTKQKLGDSSDIDGATGSNVMFYDVNNDKVYDTVIVNE